jgi:hypothetical protein
LDDGLLMGVPLWLPATRKNRLSVVHDEHAALAFTAIGTEHGLLAETHSRAGEHYRFNITFARSRAVA